MDIMSQMFPWVKLGSCSLTHQMNALLDVVSGALRAEVCLMARFVSPTWRAGEIGSTTGWF